MLNNIESLQYFRPELILTALTIGVVLIDLLLEKNKKKALGTVTFIGLLLTLFATLKLGGRLPESGESIFFGMIARDPFAVFFTILFLATAMFVVVFSALSREIEERNMGEYLSFVLATTLGSILLASSTHMLTAFLTLELVSIPCYVLAGYIRRSSRSSEASLKYVIYGAASSGLMVYGISLLFGGVGALSFEGIREGLSSSQGNEFLILTSIVFITAGIGYKIAAFPFHMWSPDIYEGAPTPITAFLSVGPKAAGFAVLVRIFLSAFSVGVPGGDEEIFSDISSVDWPLLLAMISAATMTVGNLLAINQSNIKRLLAYSSIAHAGYILMGVVALSLLGIKAVLFYFIVYLLMNLGAFLVVIAFRNHTGSESIDDYAGLGWSSGAGAIVAVTMTVFLVSLTGLPPFGGFVGKLYLFASVIKGERFAWLAVVAIANSVISLYYYFRIVKMMFLKGYDSKQVSSGPTFSTSAVILSILVVLAAAVTVSGIFWGPLAGWVESSSTLFMG